MKTINTGELLRELFEEYSEWYLGLAEDNGILPRSISGVAADGKQFIYMIDGVTLQPMARNKYIRFVLDEHQSIAYAYGGLALRGDSDLGQIEEILDVAVADPDHFIMGHWLVLRGVDGKVTSLTPMGIREGDDPGKHPSCWFLAGALRFSDAEKKRFCNLWEQARAGVVFRDRNTEG